MRLRAAFCSLSFWLMAKRLVDCWEGEFENPEP
jgi:hypothetical protein